MVTPEPRYLTIPEVMGLTRYSRRALKELRARDDQGGLPFYKPGNGRTVLYRESEVLAWLEAGRRAPATDEREAA